MMKRATVVPSATSTFLIRLESDEYGVEHFRYGTEEEMQAGWRRLTEQCRRLYRKDGVVRRLSLIREEQMIGDDAG